MALAELERPVPGTSSGEGGDRSWEEGVSPWEDGDSSWEDGEVTVMELFRRQVARRPTAPAVGDGTTELSYSQLAAAAASLARRLQLDGVKPGDAVGVYLPRRSEAVMTFLAIMGAGCAYVPLNPDLPPARLAAMCNTAAVKAVVLEQGTAWPVPGTATVELATEEIFAASSTLELPYPHPDSRAYIIFTSGSTGTPKGVEVTHRSLSVMLRWLVDLLGEDGASMAASTSFSFDPSVMELFGPLACGGKVELVQDALALVPDGRRPTGMFTTPSLCAELVRAGRVPTSVRLLMLGGEALQPELARQLLALPHMRRVVGVYGPTEATVVATLHEVRLPLGDSVPIGRAVPGTDLLVVSPDMRPVRQGERGELIILGPQVAAGYVNAPGLTAQRFVEMPGRDGAVARAYRTGDVVSERPDGALQFHGRADRQVKVRGFRVELAELESALLQLPQVSQAAALVSGVGGQASLVACVVTQGRDFDEAEAKAQLRAALPGYMVPSRFVRLDRLPLTLHGKLDEKVLAAEAASCATKQRALDDTEKLTPEEQRVADIARQVLGVGRDLRACDDFIEDLGGTSLAVVQLLSGIEAAFGTRLAVRRALADTTIGGLARLVRHGGRDASSDGCRWSGDRPPLFFVNPYVGSAVRFRQFLQHVPESTPVVGVQVYGADGASSICELAASALAEVKAAQPQGPYLVGGHSAGGLMALEVARMLRAGGDEVLDVVLVDSPALLSRLDHLWAEWVLNRQTVHSVSFGQGLALVAGALRRRLRPSGTGVADAVERATRRTNVAVRGYRPAPYSGHVTLLWTPHGRHMARGRARLGWDRVVTGHLEDVEVPGDHISMFDSQHVAALAEQVSTCVERATRTAGATTRGRCCAC
jgi:amino acid adenylation domain-containing protein